MTERVRNDIVSVLVVISLYATGVLKSDEALEGFSSEPAIVIAGVFVMSHALHQTGLSETLGGWIGRLAGSSFNRAIAVIMPAVAGLSAFTHHVTTTAVMLPVVLNLSREKSIPSSRLLLPLSFAASLGTTITIIGAPAFLIAGAVLQQSGRPGLGIFSIAPIGLSLTLAGTLFVLLVGGFLLPSRQGREDAANHFRLDEYFTELEILPDSPFRSKTIADVEEDPRYCFRVVGCLRQGKPQRPNRGELKLRVGDTLLIRAEPEEIIAIRREAGVELRPVAKYGDPAHTSEIDDEDADERLVQAVVAPNSELLGRSIGEVDFRRRYGAIVVGIWRKQGWLNQELSQIRLAPGDVLALQGDDEALARVRNDAAFLMLMAFHGETRSRRKAPLAGLVMLASILAAAFTLLSMEMAALAGAAAVILTGCITPAQAYRAVDARIYVFIAGAIPLGTAMQKTGTSNLVAEWLRVAVGGWPELLVLLALFWVVALVTQFLSDAATTAVFAPVAAALTYALGKPPESFVVTVAMSAVTAFLTPIGHHGNLLIYGPGRYQFADFVRVGTPLTVVVSLVVVVLASLLW